MISRSPSRTTEKPGLVLVVLEHVLGVLPVKDRFQEETIEVAVGAPRGGEVQFVVVPGGDAQVERDADLGVEGSPSAGSARPVPWASRRW
jgi:hypothetical protein